MSTELEKDVYIKTLEEAVEKYEHAAANKDITLNLTRKGSYIQVITHVNGVKELVDEINLNSIDRYDLRDMLKSLGYNAVITAEDETKLNKSLTSFEAKHPKLYNSLKIFLLPWMTATSTYDLIIAPIANVITLGILALPFYLGFIFL